MNNSLFNIEVFNQLLELEKEEPGFLSSIYQSYFEQAENTFGKMDEALYLFIISIKSYFNT